MANNKLNEVRKGVSKAKLDLQREVNSDLEQSQFSKTNRKEKIKAQLLQTLLRNKATIFITKNSFANLQFRNLNSYFGWLSSNGFNGFGTYTFKMGTSFKGCFEGSLSKGIGCLKYKNGDIYEGEFSAGSRNGYGHYKSGRCKYSGSFLNGKFHGKGILKTRTEEIEGIFENGRIKSGEARDCNGVFNGIFIKSGLRSWGKFTFKNGNTYNGFWEDNRFAGFGEYNWATVEQCFIKAQTKYVGYWRNGKRHGLGMQTFNERCIICQWSCGKKSGAGIIIACNGSCYSSSELFIDDQYKSSQLIRNCEGSQKTILEVINILTSASSMCLDEKHTVFLNTINRLVEQYSMCDSPINPIRIPNYEIPPGTFNLSSLESKHLQQVLVENYISFKNLYKKYTHLTEECMNELGLNLFYIDVFHKVKDINIIKVMKAGQFEIRRFRMYLYDTNSGKNIVLVPFYEFFQHFVHITKVLMENEALKSKANEIRPSFFGHLATRVLLVLRMLETNEASLFLVREGINVNFQRLLKLHHLLEVMFLGEKSIRTAYKFLNAKNIVKGGSTEFFEIIQRFYDVRNVSDILFNYHYELSSLELIEIIFRTCQLKLMKNML